MAWSYMFLVLGIAAVSAHPTDFVIRKDQEGLRYQYMRGGDGSTHLVDTWVKASDLVESARYSPDSQNEYHLFTRANPTVSQPIVPGNHGLLATTNFDPRRRTVVMVHGWLNTANAELYSVLVPAYLSAEDVNVIIVDWGAGANIAHYVTAVLNTVTSGVSVANFINWLNVVTGASVANYHLVGFSLGAHQVGIIGRHINGDVAYITALDPAFPSWVANVDKFSATDGVYTEVIHTNAGLLGYVTPLGDVDFYPNGGLNMPGCSSTGCDHDRSFFYFGESLTNGGFTGTQCVSYIGALFGSCSMSGRLQMGGLVPKTGQSGVYYLETNAAPPFSRG